MFFLLGVSRVLFFARAHAGHVHEYESGCAGAIYAGPTIGNHIYYLDWKTEMLYGSLVGSWERKAQWQLEFDEKYPLKANFALTDHPTEEKAILFHYKHENDYGGTLRFAVFDVNTKNLTYQELLDPCPRINGQPKARTVDGKVYLADIGIVNTGVFELNLTTRNCTRVGCNKETLKEKMMGAARSGDNPQDYLWFWSFDVRHYEQTTRVYYLSREKDSPHRNTVFQCDSDSDTSIQSWNVNIHKQVDIDIPVGHSYGDIFYVGPNDGLILVNGEHGYNTDEFNIGGLNAQKPNVLSGKMVYMNRDSITDSITTKICGYGLRHPYHNWINRSTNIINVGDVSEKTFEEINIVACTIDGTPINMGWPFLEGHLLNNAEADLVVDSVIEYPRFSLVHCEHTNKSKDDLSNTVYRVIWIVPLVALAVLAIFLTWRFTKKIIYAFRSPTHFCALIATLLSWSLPELFRYKEQVIDYRFGVWYGMFTNEAGVTSFGQVHTSHLPHTTWNSKSNFPLYLEMAIVQTLLILALFTPFHTVSFVMALIVPLLMDAITAPLSNAFEVQLTCYTLAWVAFALLIFSLPESMLVRFFQRKNFKLSMKNIFHSKSQSDNNKIAEIQNRLYY